MIYPIEEEKKTTTTTAHLCTTQTAIIFNVQNENKLNNGQNICKQITDTKPKLGITILHPYHYVNLQTNSQQNNNKNKLNQNNDVEKRERKGRKRRTR